MDRRKVQLLLHDPDWLRARFATGDPLILIAAELQVDRWTLRRYVKRFRIPYHPITGRAECPDLKAFRRYYYDERLSQQAIARKMGVTRKIVRSWLRRYIGKPRKAGPCIDRGRDRRYWMRLRFRTTLDDPQWLQKAYVEDRLPIAEIARRVDCSTESVRRRILRTYGEIRPALMR